MLVCTSEHIKVSTQNLFVYGINGCTLVQRSTCYDVCVCVCVCECAHVHVCVVCCVLIARMYAFVSLYMHTSCLFVNFLSCLQGYALCIYSSLRRHTRPNQLYWSCAMQKLTTRSICDGVPSRDTGGVYTCTNALNITNGPARGLYNYISSCTCCLCASVAGVLQPVLLQYTCTTTTKHLCTLHCP